jgi:1,4-alpha-glucan branching enzyme
MSKPSPTTKPTTGTRSRRGGTGGVPPAQDLEALVRRTHWNPHALLGAHPTEGGVVIRALRPAARSITVELEDGRRQELRQIHPGGVFEGVIEGAQLPLRYRLEVD